MGETVMEEMPYGFRWDQAWVERIASIKHRKREIRSWKILRVTGNNPASAVEIYVSPTGRTIHVYQHGKELT